MTMRFLPCGRHALLVELDTLDEVIGLHATLRHDPPGGVVEMVPAARTLLVTYDPAATTGPALAAAIATRPVTVADVTAAGQVEIPVVYDGADLPEVARLTGLSEREVVERHTRARYLVAFIGFAPGFAYLVGGDPALRVPRRDTPRTKVPAGAVGLAGEFTGVYPRQGPGGWQVIGRTGAVLWDLERTPPALLPPATQVRFVEVTP